MPVEDMASGVDNQPCARLRDRVGAVMYVAGGIGVRAGRSGDRKGETDQRLEMQQGARRVNGVAVVASIAGKRPARVCWRESDVREG